MDIRYRLKKNKEGLIAMTAKVEQLEARIIELEEYTTNRDLR
jgi:hypothetical protein